MDIEIASERKKIIRVLKDILRLYSRGNRELEGMGAHPDDIQVIMPLNGRQMAHSETDWVDALRRIMDVVHEHIAGPKAIWFRVWNADLIYHKIKQYEVKRGNS